MIKGKREVETEGAREDASRGFFDEAPGKKKDSLGSRSKWGETKAQQQRITQAQQGGKLLCEGESEGTRASDSLPVCNSLEDDNASGQKKVGGGEIERLLHP